MADSSNDKNTKETRTHDSNPVDFSSESEFEELEEPEVIKVLDLDNYELRKNETKSKVDDFSSESDISESSSSKVTHKKENQSNKFSSESDESSADCSSENERYVPSQDYSSESESDNSSFENAEENNKSHKCRTCEKSFRSRRSLKRHV